MLSRAKNVYSLVNLLSVFSGYLSFFLKKCLYSYPDYSIYKK